MKFKKGHIPWNKGKKCHWAKNNPQVFKEGHTPWINGKHHSESTKTKLSLALKGKPNPKVSKKLKMLYKKGKLNTWNKGKTYEQMFSDEKADKIRKKIGDTHRGNTPWNKGKVDIYSEKTLKKMSKKQLLWLKTHKHPMLGKKLTKESIKKMKNTKITSGVHKKMWQNPEFVKKMIDSRQIKPNKTEMKLSELIHEVTNDFKYNGDFSQGISIGGRIPDFVNCNGKKQVIEMFGRYWHDPVHNKKIDKRRTYEATLDDYKKFGFDCLIIWDVELKNQDTIIEKIRNFTEDCTKNR